MIRKWLRNRVGKKLSFQHGLRLVGYLKVTGTRGGLWFCGALGQGKWGLLPTSSACSPHRPPGTSAGEMGSGHGGFPWSPAGAMGGMWGCPNWPGALATGPVAPGANPPLSGTILVFNIVANDLENNEVVKFSDDTI